MSEVNDKALVEVDDASIALSMMCRDEEGLRLLWRKYGGCVKGWLEKRYGEVLSHIEIEAALNSASLSVWEAIGDYDESRGGLGSWFLRIAQNEARDLLRASFCAILRNQLPKPPLLSS